MKKLIGTLVLLAALVSAGAALGSYPKPTTTLIVVPKSIGGVKLGMPEAKARAAWGSKRGQVEEEGSAGIRYGERFGAKGSAYISLSSDHRVEGVGVYGGSREPGVFDSLLKPSAAPALMKFRDAKGNGIGTKFAKLKRAYPKGELQGKPSDVVFFYNVTSKSALMFFEILGSNKKVTSFSLRQQFG